MPSVGLWQVAASGVGFDDPSVPKLSNLGRAARAGLRVPKTFWARADALRDPPGCADPPLPLPCIVRSGSPTEDGAVTSNAGRFTSLAVRDRGEFAGAVAGVVGSLPVKDGRPQGVVFVQPLIESGRAGVTFF